MSRPSHEFFADQEANVVGAEAMLSSHFNERLAQENGSLRDPLVPDYFEIPDHLLQDAYAATRIIDVVGDYRLRAHGQKSVEYRPFQVRALNVIFGAGRYVTAAEIIQEVGERSTSHITQERAIHGLYNKTAEVFAGSLLVRNELDNGSLAYAVDPAVTFNDRRSEGQLSQAQQERQRILSSICKQFNDDPAVLRELADYAMRPIDIIPQNWRSRGLMQYQTKDFKIIPRDQSKRMLDELDDIVEACKFGAVIDDDQRRAAVLCNKLILSFLGLGHAVAFSTLGVSTKRIKTPVNEFMAYYARNDMDRPEDDAYALAALGVVHAIQTYNKELGNITNHIITQVSYKIRDGILEDRRHMYGKTQHEIKEAVRVPHRRVPVLGKHESEELFGDLPEPRTQAPDHEYESLLQTINIGPFVRAIFRSNSLRPAQKLILSLTQGIYNEEFTGRVLQGANGQKFVYDESLLHNPLFREGVSDQELSRMFNVNVSQIARLRTSALEEVGKLARRSLFMRHSKDKWKDWIW
jgi:hypothetical protein